MYWCTRSGTHRHDTGRANPTQTAAGRPRGRPWCISPSPHSTSTPVDVDVHGGGRSTDYSPRSVEGGCTRALTRSDLDRHDVGRETSTQTAAGHPRRHPWCVYLSPHTPSTSVDVDVGVRVVAVSVPWKADVLIICSLTRTDLDRQA